MNNYNNVTYYGNNDNYNKKKYKLKKRKTKFLAFGLATVLMFSVGKGIYKYKDDSDNKDIGKTYVDSESTATIKSGDDDYLEVSSLEPIEISLTSNQLKDINNYIYQNKIEYKYSNYYNLDNNLSKYYSEVKNNSNIGTFLLDSSYDIDPDKLYDLVLQNNKNYIVDKSLETSFYKEFDNSKIREICNCICQVLNDEKNKENINFNDLCNNLTNLKIFMNTSTASNAYVTENMCLILNPTMIEIFHKVDKTDYTEYNTLVHEINHLIQYASSDMNSENGSEVGICRKYNDGVDSLYWSWFLEASAEKNMNLYTGSDVTTYNYQVGYLESISLANILNDKFTINDTEKLCYGRNLEQLYELFDAKTDYDKREILNMMFSIEIIESSPESFYEEYLNNTGIDLKNDSIERENLKHELRCEVLSTLNKYFYKNLSLKIYDGNVSMQDLFYLLKTWESDIQSHLLIDQNDRLDRSYDFLNDYTELQTKLFECIAINKSCSMEDIYKMYAEYSTRVTCAGVKKEQNCDLNFLPEQKKNYILVRKSKVYKTGYASLEKLSKGNKNIKNSY